MLHRPALPLLLVALIAGAVALAQTARVAGPMQSAYVKAPSRSEAGKYLIVVGGCNGCHTPAWHKSNGNLDPKLWLTGNPEGFKGPWGTSYASNLRLSARRISERNWLRMFRTRTQKPPMPWMNVRQMSDRDVLAIYRFLRDLGPAGKPTPADLPPSATPQPAGADE